MADEVKRIRPIWGEFRDQNIDLPVADADQAIADGWAFDPYSETPREPVPVLTDEERLHMEELSAIAISKARGEDHLEPTTKASKKAEDKAAPAADEGVATSHARTTSISRRAAKDE